MAKEKPVRFNIYVPPKAIERLKELQKRCGFKTLEETIERALKYCMLEDEKRKKKISHSH